MGRSRHAHGRTFSGAIDVLGDAPFAPEYLLLTRTRWVAGPPAGSCILWPAGRFGPRLWHGGCFDSRVWGRCMSFRPFTSESYSESDRLEAWRDVLSAVGLQPSAGSAVHTGHATASRRTAEGIVLARLAAGAQAVSPLSQVADDMPIVLLPVEDGVTLRTNAGHPRLSRTRASDFVAPQGRLERGVSARYACGGLVGNFRGLSWPQGRQTR